MRSSDLQGKRSQLSWFLVPGSWELFQPSEETWSGPGSCWTGSISADGGTKFLMTSNPENDPSNQTVAESSSASSSSSSSVHSHTNSTHRRVKVQLLLGLDRRTIGHRGDAEPARRRSKQPITEGGKCFLIECLREKMAPTIP